MINNLTKNSKSRPGSRKKNKIGAENRERQGMLVETGKAETGRMEGVRFSSLQMGIKERGLISDPPRPHGQLSISETPLGCIVAAGSLCGAPVSSHGRQGLLMPCLLQPLRAVYLQL